MIVLLLQILKDLGSVFKLITFLLSRKKEKNDAKRKDLEELSIQAADALKKRSVSGINAVIDKLHRT